MPFPAGGLSRPPGRSRTLIFDPDYGGVRSLTFVDAWALQGCNLDTFYKSNNEFRDLAIPTYSPIAVQIYLTGMGLCRLVCAPGESARAGGGFPPFSPPTSICSIAMPFTLFSWAESLPRRMSRLLLHGPNPREPTIGLDLDEGGSIAAHDLIRHQALARMRVRNFGRSPAYIP